MSTQPITWFDIGNVSDIPIRGARRVELSGDTVAVFRTATDEVFAISDKCPHNGGPLSQGIVHGNCVTCPLHNWVISLSDGEAQGADEGRTRHYPIEIEDGKLRLGIAADALPQARTVSTESTPEKLSA